MTLAFAKSNRVGKVLNAEELLALFEKEMSIDL